MYLLIIFKIVVNGDIAGQLIGIILLNHNKQLIYNQDNVILMKIA